MRYTTYVNLLFACFFNDTATTEIYTLSLHDALPIFVWSGGTDGVISPHATVFATVPEGEVQPTDEPRLTVGYAMSEQLLRSEEHTSELQSRQYLVCRLLLEKTKQPVATMTVPTAACS